MYLFQRRKTRVLELINKSAQSLFLKIHWNKPLKKNLSNCSDDKRAVKGNIRLK